MTEQDKGNPSDPWKQAQEGPFSVSAARPASQAHEAPQWPSYQGAAQGHYRSAPGGQAHPGGQMPAAAAAAPWATPQPPSRKKSWLAVVLAVIVLLAVVGAGFLAFYVFFKRAARTAVSGISLAERVQAFTTLHQALNTETVLFRQNGRFTEDTDTLKQSISNLRWEKGSDPKDVGAVYVRVCDSSGSSVLLQMKSERGNVFAAWVGAETPYYYALGPISCPSVDSRGEPPAPWTDDAEQAWGSLEGSGEEVPGPEILPPAGGPRPPSIPTPYSGSPQAPAGGPTPGDGGGPGGSGPGGDDSYPYPY